MSIMKQFQAGKLEVKVYETRGEMGRSASEEMCAVLRQLLKVKDEVNIIFAAAPSQNEFLEGLVRAENIDWHRVNAFHMDEYVGLDENAPQRFGNFLKERIFGRVPLKSVFYLDGNEDPTKECTRYADLLRRYPTDIVCMGIGENGHIAFNDPHIALFNDPQPVKLVELDRKSREQQVHDGCFGKLEDVPSRALTLTIPTLISAPCIFCMVPGAKKAEAVARTITGEITEACPASILKTHDHATLYLDKNSAANIMDETGVM